MTYADQVEETAPDNEFMTDPMNRRITRLEKISSTRETAVES